MTTPQHPGTLSGSKSRDTRGSEPSQDDLRHELQRQREARADIPTQPDIGKGLSGDTSGEETLDHGQGH